MGSGGEVDTYSPTHVWRRIPKWHFPTKPNQERPNSSAFDDDPDGHPMSVIIVRPDRDPQDIISGYPEFGLVKLAIKDLQELGLTIECDPQNDEADHALVKGDKTKKIKRAMASYPSGLFSHI